MKPLKHPCDALPKIVQKTFDQIVTGRIPTDLGAIDLLVELGFVERRIINIQDGTDVSSGIYHVVPTEKLVAWHTWKTSPLRKRRRRALRWRDVRQLSFWIDDATGD